MSDKPADAPALRAKLLRAKPADFGLAATPELPRVWGAMMEMRIGAADVSLVVVAEGSTSLYFSTGGGVIGGGEHESVRAANRKLLGVIEKLFPELHALAKAALAGYKRPHWIEFVSELPKTSTGKIQRFKLRGR